MNEWQTALQKVQQEIMQWSEQNGVQVPAEVIMNWENAMQQGTKDAYDQFMEMWNQFKENPSQNQNFTASPDDIGSKPWRVAIINQIEGQNIIAIMLGLNLVNELTDLRNQVMKLDKNALNDIIKTVMDTWDKINIEIGKSSQNDNTHGLPNNAPDDNTPDNQPDNSPDSSPDNSPNDNANNASDNGGDEAPDNKPEVVVV